MRRGGFSIVGIFFLDKKRRVNMAQAFGTPLSVARIIKRTCTLAGLDPARYSGHSLRSGMATSAAAGGAPAISN